MGRVYLKEYDIALTAGGIQVLLAEGAYFRIQSSTGPITIDIDGLGVLPGLLAGQGIARTPFKRLTLRDVSGAPNVGKLLVSSEEFIDNRTFGVSTLDAATLAALESVDLNSATLAALESVDLNPATLAALESVDLNVSTRDSLKTPVSANGSFASGVAVAANTPITVFTPAANVNGAILLSASMHSSEAATHMTAFLARTVAPTSVFDGEVFLLAAFTGSSNGSAQLHSSQFIQPGQGLFFIASSAVNANIYSGRACRWRLL